MSTSPNPAPSARLFDEYKPGVQRKIKAMAQEAGLDVHMMTLATTMRFLCTPLSEHVRLCRKYGDPFGVKHASEEDVAQAIALLERRFLREIRRERNA